MENGIILSRNQGIKEIENQRDQAMENVEYNEMLGKTNTEEKNQGGMPKKDNKDPKIIRLIYYFSGVLETLFAFRFVLKLFGANPGSIFASIIYSITDLFLTPFIGIFRNTVSEGIETASIIEPKLIFGMIVYAILAVGIVKLIEITNRNKKA
jgi:hypothetical protein